MTIHEHSAGSHVALGSVGEPHSSAGHSRRTLAVDNFNGRSGIVLASACLDLTLIDRREFENHGLNCGFTRWSQGDSNP